MQDARKVFDNDFIHSMVQSFGTLLLTTRYGVVKKLISLKIASFSYEEYGSSVIMSTMNSVDNTKRDSLKLKWKIQVKYASICIYEHNNRT